MTFFCKKAQTHENLSSALQKTVHFIRKKHFSCYLSFALKIAFSNFFSLRKMFLSICGLSILIYCLVALNTELVFLEALRSDFVHLSSKMTFSAKKLKLMKICLLHCKKLFISLERNIFHVTWALLLKLHLVTFLTEKDVLSICGLSILIICLVALNTELVFLEALKKWFCAFKL